MRTVLHVDINNCYAAIECLHHPELRDKPVAVGGDVEARHGIILAKNQLAKARGVKTGEALWQARGKCPGLVILEPDFARYLRFSRLARALFAEYTDQVEPFGLDEAWLDVSASCALHGGGAAIGQEIRRRMKEELGITVSVGVSFNKVFAKLGSDVAGPDEVCLFSPENYRQAAWPLPVDELLYVGPATRQKLYKRNIPTIGHLAQTSPRLLQQWLGKWGLILHAFANGQDCSPVRALDEAEAIKSIGNSTTTPRDLKDDRDARTVFWMLAESVAARLGESGFVCDTVQISLRDNGLFRFERQMRLPRPTCLAADLCDAAMAILQANYSWDKPLRSIGLRACGLHSAAQPSQTLLFEPEAARERREAAERAIEDIRARFGPDAIWRAATGLDDTLRRIHPKEEHVIHPVGFFHAG